MTTIKGNIPVIPTPLLNGKIEFEGFDRLFERTAKDLQGYVVCGSTGEAPALTTEERIKVISYTADIMPEGKEIVVGLGHTSLTDAIKIGTAAKEKGIRYALVPSPYYFPNSLDMVIDYFGQLADHTCLDFVFYDNPVTTKTHFTTDELIAIAKAIPNVKGVKMTDHSFEKIRNLKQRTDLVVFGGDDIIGFRAFVAGVDGSMTISPVIYPEAFRDCWETFRNGDIAKSFEIYSNVFLPFISMFGPGDEIPTTKYLFQNLGIFKSGEVRTPLLAPTETRKKEVLIGYEQGLKSIINK
ncbi:dihydrodipicolinate synthase family protein [Paenibacillus solisilvae]|uniref:Dihydrodipicolinate synthase family protein n=1 Tax=Paenibacillus solisilvae TaxID=2486751 RepID=A0ABW0VZ17_9BACL